MSKPPSAVCANPAPDRAAGHSPASPVPVPLRAADVEIHRQALHEWLGRRAVTGDSVGRWMAEIGNPICRRISRIALVTCEAPLTLPKGLPRELWSTRDAAVDHALTGTQLPDNIEALMSWLEGGEYDVEFFTLDLERLASDCFDDDEAKARSVDFSEVDVLTDVDRAAIARSIIEDEIGDEDSRFVGFVIGFPLTRDDGSSALFFCETYSGGQGGSSFAFAGVFETLRQCKDCFLRAGKTLDPDPATIPDEAILKLWRHPKSKARKNGRKISKPE
jgi:hypothetical protein